MYTTIFLYGGIISLISLVGVFFLAFNKKFQAHIEKNLLTLTTLSAGVFLITSLLMIREVYEILPLHKFLMSLGIGTTLYLGAHYFFKPHRILGHHHEHKHTAWKMIIGDTIHNMADGLFLVASFGMGSIMGTGAALSIILHETPQEISEFFVLKKSGYTNSQALVRNFISALAIFIGIAIGLFVMNTVVLQAWLLGISASFFIGVVFTDLFPVSKLYKEKRVIRMLIPFAVGIIIMGGIAGALGHTHNHEESEHDINRHHHDESHDDHHDHFESENHKH